MKGLVEFLERLLGIDEALQPGPLDKLLFVALPAGAVNEIVIQGPVFVRMLQVQSAGFDSVLNVQEEQSLIEGDAKLALLGNGRPLLSVQETGWGRFVDRAVFLFEVLDGVH